MFFASGGFMNSDFRDWLVRSYGRDGLWNALWLWTQDARRENRGRGSATPGEQARGSRKTASKADLNQQFTHLQVPPKVSLSDGSRFKCIHRRCVPQAAAPRSARSASMPCRPTEWMKEEHDGSSTSTRHPGAA